MRLRYSVEVRSSRKGLFLLRVRGPRGGQHGTYELTEIDLDLLVKSCLAAKEEQKRLLRELSSSVRDFPSERPEGISRDFALGFELGKMYGEGK